MNSEMKSNNMSKIHILSQDLINKIAAGEVVERPASIVKELLENSLDAGATDIAIDIEDGGLQLIRVVDNGTGMAAEDVPLALQRYATSKISTVHDLNQLSSFGFRGEALAAISAVTDFRLASRKAEAITATEVRMANGSLSTGSAALPKGTMVEAKSLFANVPARKKFLKAASTEFRHILSVVVHQALLFPEVAWKLTHNGKTMLNLPAVKDWADRVAMVWGKEQSAQMLPLHHQRASLIITGFLSHPSKARQSKQDQYVFVNRRAVQDFLLAKAVLQGYSHHIEPGRYPAFVLHVSIAPDLVDANVHPRKTEVRFADPSGVFRETAYAVNKALGAAVTTVHQPHVHQHKHEHASVPASTQIPFAASSPAVVQSHKHSQPLFQSSVGALQPTTAIATVAQPELGDWKLVGQVHRSYLLVETRHGMLVVDQHAAAEKILYEKMLASAGKPKMQRLLVPLVLEFSAKQQALFEAQKEAFASIGIEAEEFGERTVRLTAIPQDLDVSDLKEFLFGVLEDMEGEAFDKIPSLNKRRERVAKYAACRGAIKFNDPLNTQEQIQLLTDIRTYKIVACCHGRPVMIEWTKDELKRHFHRP